MRALPFPASYSANLLWFSLLGLLLLTLLAASSGVVTIPFWRIPELLSGNPAGEQEQLWQTLLLEVRLPRIVLALLVGGSLAVAGCALQALFRNPLAEPGLIGVSGGAALAAALALIIFPSQLAAPPAAFAGALVACWLAWLIGRGGDHARLLLAGVAINTLSGAGLTLITHLASDQGLRSALSWAMGSLSGAQRGQLLWLTPALLLLAYLIWRERRALDALLLGEREAFHLGHEPRQLSRRLLAITALMVALSVSACGALAFVGLLAPHLARLLIGPQHQRLLPLAAMVGAATLLLADWLARMAISPSELPLAAVLGLAGAPCFLWLLLRSKPC